MPYVIDLDARQNVCQPCVGFTQGVAMVQCIMCIDNDHFDSRRRAASFLYSPVTTTVGVQCRADSIRETCDGPVVNIASDVTGA